MDDCRNCETQRRPGHHRLCEHHEAYTALVAYCDLELPEAWDNMRSSILLAVHLLAMLLTEAATVTDEDGMCLSALQCMYDSC
jgi:hypothetical protein